MSADDATTSRETTERRMQNPRVGDTFHEMLSFFVIVLHVDENGDLTTLEGHPSTWWEQGRLWRGSPDAFRSKFSYRSRAGYWVMENGQHPQAARDLYEAWTKRQQKAQSRRGVSIRDVS